MEWVRASCHSTDLVRRGRGGPWVREQLSPRLDHLVAEAGQSSTVPGPAIVVAVAPDHASKMLTLVRQWAWRCLRHLSRPARAALAKRAFAVVRRSTRNPRWDGTPRWVNFRKSNVPAELRPEGGFARKSTKRVLSAWSVSLWRPRRLPSTASSRSQSRRSSSRGIKSSAYRSNWLRPWRRGFASYSNQQTSTGCTKMLESMGAISPRARQATSRSIAGLRASGSARSLV